MKSTIDSEYPAMEDSCTDADSQTQVDPAQSQVPTQSTEMDTASIIQGQVDNQELIFEEKIVN
jgi:hypothetical protein